MVTLISLPISSPMACASTCSVFLKLFRTSYADRRCPLTWLCNTVLNTVHTGRYVDDESDLQIGPTMTQKILSPSQNTSAYALFFCVGDKNFRLQVRFVVDKIGLLNRATVIYDSSLNLNLNTCHTWALLRWWFTTKRRYIKCMYLLPFYLSTLKCYVAFNNP